MRPRFSRTSAPAVKHVFAVQLGAHRHVGSCCLLLKLSTSSLYQNLGEGSTRASGTFIAVISLVMGRSASWHVRFEQNGAGGLVCNHETARWGSGLPSLSMSGAATGAPRCVCMMPRWRHDAAGLHAPDPQHARNLMGLVGAPDDPRRPGRLRGPPGPALLGNRGFLIPTPRRVTFLIDGRQMARARNACSRVIRIYGFSSSSSITAAGRGNSSFQWLRKQ